MKNILVPLDFSDLTERVLELAVQLARATGADMTLLHVAPPDPDFVGYEPGPPSVRQAVAERFREEHRRLQELDRRLEKSGLVVRSLLVQGVVVEKILKEAARLEAGLIVMGSHGRGALYHLLVGSVTEGVLRKAACPVLVVPRTAEASPGL